MHGDHNKKIICVENANLKIDFEQRKLLAVHSDLDFDKNDLDFFLTYQHDNGLDIRHQDSKLVSGQIQNYLIKVLL